MKQVSQQVNIQKREPIGRAYMTQSSMSWLLGISKIADKAVRKQQIQLALGLNKSN